jgi:hypothetical protein
MQDNTQSQHKKITGFEASLQAEGWPPRLVNTRGFKKVEFPVDITYENSQAKEVQDSGPSIQVQGT